MNTRKITGAVVIAVTIGLIGWDIFARIHGGYEATISAVIFETAFKEPVVPFAFGFLMGHLFWGQ